MASPTSPKREGKPLPIGGGQRLVNLHRIARGEVEPRMESDPAISLGLGVVLQALSGARWEVRESDWAGASPRQRRKLAAFVTQALGMPGPGSLRRPWDEIAQQMAWFVWYGDLPCEIVWHTPDASGLRLPADIVPLDPDEVVRFRDPKTKEYGPVIQRGVEPIDGRKIIHLHRALGGLRDACLAPWQRKRVAENIRQAALNFRGVNPPEVRKNLEKIKELGLPDGVVQDATQSLVDAIAGIQAGDHSVLTTLTDVIYLDWSNNQGIDTQPFINIEEREDTNIHSALGTLFLRMGVNGEGNRSLGEVHMQLISRAAQNHALAIASALNGPWRPGGGLVGALIELNFPEGEEIDPRAFPRIEPTGLEPRAVLEALSQLPSLQASGWLTPTPDKGDEAILRAGLGLPPPSIDSEEGK